MSNRNRKSSKSITITVDKGETAVCGDPGDCLIARKLRAMGFKTVKVQDDFIRFTVQPNSEHARTLGVGRYTVPTPGRVGAFIGQWDQPTTLGQCVPALRNFNFVLDLTAPGVVFTPKVHKSREVLDKLAADNRATMKRVAQVMTAHERETRRNENKARARRGEKPLPALDLSQVVLVD